MLCSNCGFENPQGHRYCGMCGTPFPHRSLTVPSAQSTLSFSSAPLEITAPVKPAGVGESLGSAVRLQTAAPSLRKEEAIPVESVAVEAEHAEVVEHPSFSRVPEEIATEQEPESGVSPRLTEAGAASAETDAVWEPVVELERPRVTEAGVFAQDNEPSAPVHQPDSPPPPPVHEPETPAKPPQDEPEQPIPPSRLEPEFPVAPEPKIQPTTPIRSQPTTQRVDWPHTPVVRTPRPAAPVTTIPERPASASTLTVSQPRPFVHQSPDSLPITPPPASAGMPTFQEVADAAGAPPLSPFEQLAQTPAAEDDELKQFVANFRYTPPEETADELTMRSEVPVVDKEIPAEFHHPSFDGDEPPPAAEPHPTGQEYYPPPGEAPRSRFLEIDEAAHQAKKRPEPRHGSVLGLETPTTIPASEVAPVPLPRRRNWLWISILVLIAVFGTLGFFEGRAQIDVFRGPIEWTSMEYGVLRDKLKEMLATKAPATPKASEPTPQQTAQQSPSETKPDTPAEQAAAPRANSAAPPIDTTQPDTNNQANNAGSTSEPTTPQAHTVPPIETQATNTAAATTPAKPIEPPPTAQPSNRAQPGQQELMKALDASDATAAAAWLWKATSRGNPEAPVRLADMYIRGNGVPRSCEQALVLLRSAAMKENAPARNRLAALYANGTCVGRDKIRAYQLMSSALQADPNSEWAKENRQALWNQMTPSERAMAQKNR